MIFLLAGCVMLSAQHPSVLRQMTVVTTGGAAGVNGGIGNQQQQQQQQQHRFLYSETNATSEKQLNCVIGLD